MRLTDNNTQLGTGKNVRRMCLHHQTIQYLFLCYWNKNRKEKEKKGEKKSLKFLDFLDRVSLEESCKVGWPCALGGPWHQGSYSPGCSALGLGFSCDLSTFPLPGPCGEHRGAFLGLALGGCPNKGLLETPAHLIHCGKRSQVQECYVSPEKPILEVVAGPLHVWDPGTR